MEKQEFLSLVNEQFQDKEELDIINRALDVAIKSHEGQKRESGEDYVSHPMAVAGILVKLGLDYETIAAALLHDVLEDTSYTKDQMRADFSQTIVNLVDGVTKINQLNFKTKEDEQAENLRKMLLAMAHDIRVVIIKLADRLHNMRTLSYKSKESQILNSRETLDIFAPIAARLGMGAVKCELEDIAMKYLYPEEFSKIFQAIMETKVKRDEFVEKCSKILYKKLAELNIKGEVNGRPKHIYSIFLKMQRGKNFDQIYDLIAMRIIVPTVKDCYEMLGVIHTMWKPLPGRFKDYIAMPKPNMYQSLHTTVISQFGSPFEIQIRTFEMHRIAEYGIAAHWIYKEKGENKDDKFAWIREVIETQKDAPNSKAMLDSIKMDLYPDEVFIFTPDGDVKSLPYGATALDFAYKVHSEVGNKCTGVKIDAKMMPLNTQLETGNIVEIITNKASKGPSRDWLTFVKTQGAKNKIKAFFKKSQKCDNIKLGRDMLEREAKKRNQNLKNLLKPEFVEELLKRYAAHDIDDVYAMIGFGDLSASQVLFRLMNLLKQELDKAGQIVISTHEKPTIQVHKKDHSGIIIKGYDDFLIRISKCCNPVPGDKIIGYISRGRGVSIHRADCPNISSFETERLIDATWPLDVSGTGRFQTNIELVTYNTVSIMAEVTRLLSKYEMPIFSMRLNKSEDNKTSTVSIGVEIKDIDDVKTVIDKLEQIKDVIKVYRA